MQTQTSLTIHQGGQLATTQPVPGLSVYENKAVQAWNTPKVCDRMTTDREGTEKALAAVIAIKLQDAARKSGVSKSATGEEQTLIVKDIIEVLQEFPRLRLGEISLIFDLGAIGRFGDFAGHSLNARTFRAWILAFESEERNKLIAKQIEAEQIADELRASPVKSSRLLDLLSSQALVKAYSQVAANRQQMPDLAISEKEIPNNIDLSRVWFKKFKERGLLEKLAPLTIEEKKKIFADQVNKVKYLNRTWGASWLEAEKQVRAKIMSEDLWLRMAIANLINQGTTPEEFEGMLIRETLIPATWRKDLLSYENERI